MSYLNRPDKIVADSYSDEQLEFNGNNGVFSSFNNNLTTPLLNVKGLQLLRANFVNPILQLNDYSQLTFWYYRTAAANTPFTTTNLFCVRLHPSWFVPLAGFTNFVRNAYFNNGTELVTALNAAAAAGGDNVLYNTRWAAGDVTFSFNPATRKISFTGNQAGQFYSPAPYDDPNVRALVVGLTMNAFNAVTAQPFSFNNTMNSRLGFAINFTNRGRWWGGTSRQGCASATGVPQANGTATEADAYPIMIGSQNINVYCSVINGSGNDSRNRKNLLATIPLENVAQGVNSYTLTSVENPSLSLPSEIYNLQFYFTDDVGDDVFFFPNANVNLELDIFY